MPHAYTDYEEPWDSPVVRMTVIPYRLTMQYREHAAVVFIDEIKDDIIKTKLLECAARWGCDSSDIGYIAEPNPFA